MDDYEPEISQAQIRAVHLKKPANEVEVEKAFFQMAKVKLKSDSFRRFGRKGQKQYGIDHTGYESDDGAKLVVLQSKCRGPDKSEAPADIKKHLNYWLETGISFSKFIYCTTADPDQNLHRAALEATQWLLKEHKKNALVLVWDWGTIQDECDANQTILKIWDTEFISKDDRVVKELSGLQEQVGSGFDDIQSTLQTGLNQILKENEATGKHDSAISLLNEDVESRPKSAIAQADKLLSRDDLNDKDRSRLISIKGNACLFLGNYPDAIRHFKAAYKITPNRPNSITNYALALGLGQEIEELRTFANDKIKLHFENEMLAARCAYFLKDLTVIPEGIPIGSSLSAMKLELQRVNLEPTKHRILCEEAYRSFNESTHRTILSVAILDELSEKKLLHPASFWNAADKKHISNVIDLLSQNFEDICVKGNCYNHKDSADINNLCIAQRLAGQSQNALETAQIASDLEGGKEKFKHIIAVTLAELGRHGEALDILSGTERTSDSVQMEISFLLQENNWKKLIEVCDEFTDLLEPKHRFQAQAIKNIANIFLKPIEEHDKLLKELFSSKVDNVLEVAIYAQVAQKHGIIDSLLPTLEKSKSTVSAVKNNEDDRFILSKIFRDLGDDDALFELLQGHVPLDTYSQALSLLTEAAAYEHPRRDRDKKLFESIDKSVLEHPRIKFLLGVFEFTNGEIHRAISIFTDLNKANRSLKYITWICRCAFKLRNYKLITSHLNNDDILSLPGSAGNCLELAGHANRDGKMQLATSLGMRAIRSGYHSPEITSGFTTLMMMNNQSLPESLVVSEGVFVSVTRPGDEPLQGIVAASTDRPWAKALDPNELPLLKVCLGKFEGEEVSLKTGLGSSEPWKISSIQPEWLRATQFLMKEHEQHFGDKALMMRFTVTEDDISPILDQLTAVERRFEDQCQVILDQNIPLRLISGERSFGAVGFAEAMRQKGKHIPTAFGRPSSTQKSIDATIACSENGKGAVIDMLTAVTAVELNLLSPIKKLFGEVYIPSDDIERFQLDLESPGLLPFGETMVGTVNGDLRVWKRDQVDLETTKSIGFDILDEIKATCKVVKFTFPDPEELSSGLNHIAKLSPETLSPILLARETGAILISEDRALRTLAKQELDVDGTWLQFCSLHCLTKGILSRPQQLKISSSLISYRHMFYYLTVRDLFDAARFQISGQLTKEFDILASRLGDDDISPDSRIEVTARFIFLKLSGNKWSVTEAAQCGRVLHEHFRNIPKDRVKNELFELKNRLSLDPLKYLEQWAVGHFMGLALK